MKVQSINEGSITLDITPEELYFLEKALDAESERRKEAWVQAIPSNCEELTFKSMAVESTVGMKVVVTEAMRTVKLNGVFK